ncbi:nicotinamide riboside transporter PnuC [bacterium]|nr:nicotinamide riboside transporter PnuC [bacterium]
MDLSLRRYMNLPEIAGVIFAVAYLLLAMRESPLCWFAGVISSLCFLKVFFDVRLFAEAFLQLFYVAISLHGFYRWKTGGSTEGRDLSISRYTARQHFVRAGWTLLFAFLLGAALSLREEGAVVYVDALITVASISTTLLVTEKILENWLYWIAINFASGLLAASKGLSLTALLFFGYVLLSFAGYRQWKKAYDGQCQ